MDANITLYPGQMQQIRFVMPTDLTFTAISEWDYGITIVVNNKDTFTSFSSNSLFDLKSVSVIEISNAGHNPFIFSTFCISC